MLFKNVIIVFYFVYDHLGYYILHFSSNKKYVASIGIVKKRSGIQTCFLQLLIPQLPIWKHMDGKRYDLGRF